MIPFEVDPSLYIFSAFMIITLGILVIVNRLLSKTVLEQRKFNIFTICCLIFGSIIVLYILGNVCFGTVYTEEITICNHVINQGSMPIIDTNQKMYYVSGEENKLKIINGETITAHIEKRAFGEDILVIYKIDNPVTCKPINAMGC